jgi:hypothetical protein
MAQAGGFNICRDCALWRGVLEPRARFAERGLCLRANIGDWANIATPLIVTSGLDVCVNFTPADPECKDAGSAWGANADPALVIAELCDDI